MTLKKSVLCLSVLTASALLHISASAIGNEHSGLTANNTTKTVPANVDDYIGNVYNEIDFGHAKKLSPEVFNKAMHGYLNLQEAGKLNKPSSS